MMIDHDTPLGAGMNPNTSFRKRRISVFFMRVAKDILPYETYKTVMDAAWKARDVHIENTKRPPGEIGPWERGAIARAARRAEKDAR